MKSFGFPWRSTFVEDFKKNCFNQPGLKFLSDARLVSKTASGGVAVVEGGRSASDILMNNDLVGLYFSAHWCGPCRGFTPVFAEVHIISLITLYFTHFNTPFIHPHLPRTTSNTPTRTPYTLTLPHIYTLSHIPSFE